MDEDESFDEFYAKLKDIVNSAFNLGEQIPKPKIVRKILKSPPERFHAKITTIEESKDLDSIPLIKLIGNLQTYELGDKDVNVFEVHRYHQTFHEIHQECECQIR